MGVCFLWTYPLQQRYEYKQSMFSKMESSSQETAPQLLQQQCHRKDLATQGFGIRVRLHVPTIWYKQFVFHCPFAASSFLPAVNVQ
ncbi:hypothetical protein MUK42_15811 [Musa troglodytarum]|uniref:Uncharacterized protein n=1 Tax=Musa troglodytarum TaxID=320322 RepID=A0A9E7JMS4_9LILI|nr:hypothetical protein MUK42_15811 [Musa troglodytarum]